MIIREGLTEEEAKIAERKLIKHYDSRNRSKGYNITPGGDTSPMKDPAVRKKSSESHKGMRQTEEQKEHLRQLFTGRIVPEDTKRKVSETIKKLWQDPEHRAKHITSAKSRPVIACDTEGKVVAMFNSLKQADSETGTDYRNIQACCKGKRKTSGGYVWRYADEHANTEVNVEIKESA